MLNEKDKWSALSMKERADLIKLYVSNGITSINDIKKDYNSFAPGGPIETDEYGYPADITPAVVEADYPRENEVWKRADASNADMVQRLRQGSSRVTIQDWEDPKKVATHKMMSAGNYVVGNVQNINGQLFDFTDPKHGFENPDRAAIDSAIKRGDYIKFDTEGDARYFAEHYKKHYNSFDDGGKKSKIVTAEMTPSQAIKYNESADNAAFMIPYGGTPDNPEFLYPEELEESVVVASAKEAERKALEKEVAKLNSSDAWKYIGLRQGENLEANKHAREYVEPLVNAAIGGIGGTLLATNPFTTELAIDALQGTGHATHVMLDPLAANTMFGAFLGTASQAAGITAGIYNASNTIDKWRSGNFNWYDIPYFALDATSAIPVINTMFGLADDAARMTRNTYNAQKAVKSNTKVGSNTSKLTEADVQNAGYINSIDDVTLDPYSIQEIPEEAFISKPNLTDEVKTLVKPSITEQASLNEKELYQKFLNAINRSDVQYFNVDAVNATDISKLKKILLSAGIDEQLLTNRNLNRLISSRFHDYKAQSAVDNMAFRTNWADADFHYSLYRKGNPRGVGFIDVSDYRKYPSNIYVNDSDAISINMVRSAQPGILKGVSEQGYNAVIGDLGYVNSGKYLLSPEKTTKVWQKYGDKTLLGMFGRQGNSFDDFPVYRLNSPTYNVPVKYLDDFGLEGLSPDGTFIVDFTKGPTYENGGKLLTKRK